jgi:sorbitol/mannitol transport system permease protein
MAARALRSTTLWAGIAGWAVAIIMFFPILWMVMTAFKTEIAAISTPPQFIFSPTMENFSAVNSRADYFHYAWNSIIESVGATIISLAIAVPAAYATAFFPSKRTKDLLL